MNLGMSVMNMAMKMEMKMRQQMGLKDMKMKMVQALIEGFECAHCLILLVAYLKFLIC